MNGKILNEKQKEELRNWFEKLLEDIPEDVRISINTTVLRQLLFTVRYDIENHRIIRYPIWTGQFLRKIDLSQISFENVDWNLSNFDGRYYYTTIDLSYTNANIDFSKTSKELVSCNFSHMDLSKSNTKYIKKAIGCDFSYSKAVFDFNTETLESKKLYFEKCYFNGLDLSDSYIDAYYILYHEYPEVIGFINSNFSNTGLTIIKSDKPTQFYECLFAGNLEGCYYYERDYEEESSLTKQKILI